MAFLLDHWHCILPLLLLAISIAVLISKQGKQNDE
jgi:hypothetical protein